MDSLPIALGVYVLVTGSIYKLFKEADDVIDKGAAKNLTKFLNGEISYREYDWVPDFNKLSDKLFGTRFFSLRAITVSAIISLLVFNLLLFTISKMNKTSFDSDLGYLYMMLLPNIIVDFLSFCQTRWLLKADINTSLKIVSDSVCSIILIPLGAILGMIVLVSLFFGELELDPIISIYQEFYSNLLSTLTGESQTDGDGINAFIAAMTISTMSTSVWIWLHALSVFLIGYLSQIPSISRFLNTEEKPFLCLGIILNLLVLSSAIVVIPLSVLLS